MVDKNGNLVAIGARVRYIDASGMKRTMTVRRFNSDGDAQCDDGDPGNDNNRTNGSRLLAWLRKGMTFEVLP